MLTLAPERMQNLYIPVSTSWLLADCMEARGKQDLWLRQKPEVLEALRTQAIIQSSESSNRIEGVTVQAARLRPLLIGRARPRDRSEEELAGYRRALDWIFTRKLPVQITPRVITHLHRLAQSPAHDAGRYKSRDNEIIEFLPSGERRVRFRPTPARETPAALRSLCTSFEQFSAAESLPPLLTVATFVFDLLCIHPFRDGNGRAARLASTLLLQQQGFQVARYLSLERLIEQRKEDYYRALGDCSRNWHEGKNEIVPWWNFFLAIVRAAYRELERDVSSIRGRPAKGELVRQFILAQPDAVTLAEIKSQVAAASPQLIRRVLANLKREGIVQLAGRGRSAHWRVVARRNRPKSRTHSD